MLEDEAERAQPDLGELAVAERVQVAALEEHLARARTVERAEQLEQRRLAGAARALERDELARRDREIDASSGAIVTSPRRNVRARRRGARRAAGSVIRPA